MKNYYPKSYKEKKNPTPHESGRKEKSRTFSPQPARDEIKEDENLNYTEDTTQNELEGVLGESAFDAEQKIYDTIDDSLGLNNIPNALKEALEYDEEYEKDNDTSHKKEKITSLNNTQEGENNISLKHPNRNHNKNKDKFGWITEEANRHHNTKARNGKNKKHYRRYQHVNTEPANRIKKGVKKKNIDETQKDIEKYGFAA